MIQLHDATILVDDGEPLFVRRGIADLRTYVGQITGQEPIVAQPVTAMPSGQGAVIIVGCRALARLSGELRGAPVVTGDEVGAQGFVLAACQWTGSHRPVLVIAGAGDQGTKYGLIEMVTGVIDPVTGTVPDDLNRWEQPAFRRRGLYLHLGWTYNHPYAIRRWSLGDWQKFIDLITYFKLNLLQFWPVADIIPHPLSPDDRDYLERLRAVIHYAKQERGVEVWIAGCANTIAQSSGGVPIEDRELFDHLELRDPGDPDQLTELMSSRADLYEVMNNANAYAIIDGDPGGWLGSQPHELVDIFLENRALIDRYCGKDVPLIYWVWVGWGIDQLAVLQEQGNVPERTTENILTILRDMKERLPEPWLLEVCRPSGHAALEALPLWDRTILFRYEIIEPEPHTPVVLHNFNGVREMMDLGSAHHEMLGVMGNCQTPLAQLPNIYYFSRCAWNVADCATSDAAVLDDLARLFYGADGGVLAAAWQAIAAGSAAETQIAAERLWQTVEGGGPAAHGPLASCIFPKSSQVALDAMHHARIYASARAFIDQVQTAAPPEAIATALADHLAAAVRYHRVHNYHGSKAADGYVAYFPARAEPKLNASVRTAWQTYNKRLGLEQIHNAGQILSTVRRRLLAEPGVGPAIANLLLYQATTEFQQLLYFAD